MSQNLKEQSSIVIIDYNSGNIGSVFNAIASIKNSDQEVIISNKPEDLKTATHIILPGVGAFADCKAGLLAIDGMVEEIKKQIKNNKPFLGICVGMQLLADIGYEEKEVEGLGLISGQVKKLNCQGGLKIPHIGWNELDIVKNHDIVSEVSDKDHVYFVHSYYFDVANKENIVATASYGTNIMSAIIAKDNIVAMQFHPEKSAKAGLQILKNFINSN